MGELKAEAITVGYGSGPAIVRDASVAVSSGTISVLLGPNGAGKSTLMKALVGLLAVRSGKVILDGRDVTGMRPFELVRNGVGYLPQLLNVFDELTVHENLEMGAFTFTGDFHRRVEEVCELFPDLPGIFRKRAGKLSGGQQRMVAMARALMVAPQMLTFDEPTAGLSPVYQERVWSQIRTIRDSGVGLLIVEQNATLALRYADHVYILADGTNALSGPADELRDRDEVAELLVG